MPTRFSETWRLFGRGLVSETKVRIVVECCGPLDDDSAREVDRLVGPRALRLTPSRLREAARRAVLRVDPAAAAERRERATAERRVHFTPVDNGMAELYALLPAQFWLGTSRRATAPVGSQGATVQPLSATSTTPSPFRMDRPAGATLAFCADATTASSTTRAVPPQTRPGSDHPCPDTSSGPCPPGKPTSCGRRRRLVRATPSCPPEPRWLVAGDQRSAHCSGCSPPDRLPPADVGGRGSLAGSTTSDRGALRR
jgi:hypothetical protein